MIQNHNFGTSRNRCFMYYGTSSGAPVSYGKMACHTICVSARVVNDKNFVKNLLNKKIIKISPKLTISEIIDEAESESKTKDAYSLMMNTRGNEQCATLIDTENDARFTQKDKLYNKVCEHLTANKFFFPNSMAKDDVKKNVFILVNCLWYLDGNYQKIVERSSHDSTIGPIPQRFVFHSVLCLQSGGGVGG